MDNALNNIGDVLLVTLTPQISGRISFTGFTEDIDGETLTRSLKKEFRISTDEVFWTEWAELNNENLSSEEFLSDGSLTIQIRYTRTGTDASGSIVFNSIDFIGNREEIQFVAPTLLASIFSDLVGTSRLSKLERNIFKKLYYRGILPNYIKRGENSSYSEDRDFVDLFFSVARFFSLFISFFKRWENFENDFDLLREQVRGYGIYFDESSITLEELQYLAQNVFSQAQQRGTKMIFSRKGDILPGGKIAEIDGEFVRLTRNRECDELLYENIPIWKSGWCMRQSSPIYRGTAQAYNLNKTKENTQDFQDISNFKTFKSGITPSVSIQSVDSKRVLRLEIGSSGGGEANAFAGLGLSSDISGQSYSKDGNFYTADSALDYEITFAFKIISASALGGVNLIFGVDGFDINKDKLIDAFVKPNGSSVSNQFFSQPLSIWKVGQWYYARGIIHAYSSQNADNIKTNLGIGNDLYFNNSFVKYILPRIQITTTQTVQCVVDIWDYKIRPLIRGKNIIPLKDDSKDSRSLGFIQSSKIFYTYVRNNNNSQSQDEITDIIEKYLYPFNTIDMFTIMSNY